MQSFISLNLKLRQLRHDQLQTIKLSMQLRLQPWWQWLPIPSAKFVQTFAAILADRFKAQHALCRQQALDPVHVTHPLGH
jgi:hypothetical protein